MELFAAADRFVTCQAGHRHWGRFGAAGVLLADSGRVLLAKRSPRTHLGNTWSTPGGAIQSGEQPLAAALRELAEETSILLVEPVEVLAHHVDDHGGWSYQTFIIATAASSASHVQLQWETTQIQWLERWQVDELALRAEEGLHPGFARSWPDLRARVPSRSPTDRGPAPSAGG